MVIREQYNYGSSLYTEVGTCCLTLSAQSVSVCESVSPIHFSPALSIMQALKHKTLTQCWANIGPPSTTTSTTGYRFVFGAKLNVGQCHRRRVNINLALVQSIVPVPPPCRYLQHEVLTRTEWLLASTGDAGPAFNGY